MKMIIDDSFLLLVLHMLVRLLLLVFCLLKRKSFIDLGQNRRTDEERGPDCPIVASESHPSLEAARLAAEQVEQKWGRLCNSAGREVNRNALDANDRCSVWPINGH